MAARDQYHFECTAKDCDFKTSRADKQLVPPLCQKDPKHKTREIKPGENRTRFKLRSVN